MPDDKTVLELHGYRIGEAEKKIDNHEERMDTCEQQVQVLIAHTDRMVQSNDKLGDKLDRYVDANERRLATVEAEQASLKARQDSVEKRFDEKGAVATGNGLQAPTEGPAYYLAVALKWGGIPIAIAVGILIIVGGSIWVLNKLGIV